ncbi:hypothetical protein FPSE_04662 [Fusarium pseudograminearum CS3096]|uniref:Uncharacterized protein n=1 Tax=Fusarium pseudograminearum (strain CS3096) TaxID=1028729 RepID=K3VKY1_FUSPC|nr:hypothetical protein FPSE_04662 [Fusarium pseudograminearum CS3096]EKJ75189.1 hypothetical protein FPSE_04662 [Fusarium pseudograminearum CS3096]
MYSGRARTQRTRRPKRAYDE